MKRPDWIAQTTFVVKSPGKGRLRVRIGKPNKKRGEWAVAFEATGAGIHYVENDRSYGDPMFSLHLALVGGRRVLGDAFIVGREAHTGTDWRASFPSTVWNFLSESIELTSKAYLGRLIAKSRRKPRSIEAPASEALFTKPEWVTRCTVVARRPRRGSIEVRISRPLRRGTSWLCQIQLEGAGLEERRLAIATDPIMALQHAFGLVHERLSSANVVGRIGGANGSPWSLYFPALIPFSPGDQLAEKVEAYSVAQSRAEFRRRKKRARR